MKFTAFIEESDDGWFVGQVEEFPSVISQGKNIEELKLNLLDALNLLMEVNRDMVEKEHIGRQVIHEELVLR